MRYSGLMLLALVVTAISPHRAIAGVAQAGFCGTPPPGWTPPGKPKAPGPGEPDATCHLMACDRRKVDRKACQIV